MNIKKKLATAILATVMAFSSISAISVNAAWEKTDAGTKYTDSKGEYVTGWLTMKNGNTYYFKKDGTMSIGWLKTGGKKYYFKSNGVMATGNTVIGKKIYEFDTKGVFKKQLKDSACEIDGKIYYCLKDGSLAKGMQEIDYNGETKCYYFGDKGYAISTTKTIKYYVYTFDAKNGLIKKEYMIQKPSSYNETTKLITLNNFKISQVDSSYTYTYSGSVLNNSDYDYHIVITFNFYDASGNLIKSNYEMTRIDKLYRGESTLFVGEVTTSSEVAKCTVAAITAYTV